LFEKNVKFCQFRSIFLPQIDLLGLIRQTPLRNVNVSLTCNFWSTGPDSIRAAAADFHGLVQKVNLGKGRGDQSISSLVNRKYFLSVQ